jgi:predicted nucleic acid-binding protein
VKVVSNSSPLIALTRVNHLLLLQRLYSELYLPAAVWHEVVVQGRGQPGAAAVQGAPWIVRSAIRNAPLVLSLTQDLGAGEAEAIVLAQELPADLLIVDERHAREKARRLGIPVIGVLGVLLEAKARRLLPAVRPVVDDLKNIAGFHSAPQLMAEVLRQAGES